MRSAFCLYVCVVVQPTWMCVWPCNALRWPSENSVSWLSQTSPAPFCGLWNDDRGLGWFGRETKDLESNAPSRTALLMFFVILSPRAAELSSVSTRVARFTNRSLPLVAVEEIAAWTYWCAVTEESSDTSFIGSSSVTRLLVRPRRWSLAVLAPYSITTSASCANQSSEPAARLLPSRGWSHQAARANPPLAVPTLSGKSLRG